MWSRLRIRLVTLLSIGFGSFVLIAVAVTGALGWWAVRQATSDLLSEKAVDLINDIERGLAQALTPSQAQVEGLGRLIESGRLDAHDPASMVPVLLAGLAASPEMTAIVVLDDTNIELAAWREADGRLMTEALEQERSELQRALVERAREHPGIEWGEVIFAETIDDALANIRYGVHRDGRFVALVAAGVTARRLSDLVRGLVAGTGVTAFVLYGRDRVLAHPLLAGTPGEVQRTPLPALDALGDPVLARIWDNAPTPVMIDASEQDVTAARIDGPDGLHLVLRKQLAHYGEVPWHIGVIVPSELFAPYFETLTRTGIAAIVLSLGGFAVALVMGRVMARAIGRVTAGAERIATLDLEDIKPLPPSRVRELDAQASAYNAMLATLRAFETYVPKTLVRRLIRAGRADAVSSHERDLTVMFTDIAGFTTLSESMPPAEVAALLNEHFAKLAACVDAEGGTVDKYLGDGMMAFWGAPERVKGRAERACRCALAMCAAIGQDNERRRAAGRAPVRVRIGIHRGPLLVGNIGAPGRINYTVVGDTVNVAQRLQDLGRQVADGECVVVVSDAVVADAGPGFAFAEFGAFPVKGRQEPVRAFALLKDRPAP